MSQGEITDWRTDEIDCTRRESNKRRGLAAWPALDYQTSGQTDTSATNWVCMYSRTLQCRGSYCWSPVGGSASCIHTLFWRTLPCLCSSVRVCCAKFKSPLTCFVKKDQLFILLILPARLLVWMTVHIDVPIIWQRMEKEYELVVACAAASLILTSSSLGFTVIAVVLLPLLLLVVEVVVVGFSLFVLSFSCVRWSVEHD